MPAFAEIVLVTTLCLSANGTPTTGDDCAETFEPQTWTSSNVVEARKDWNACLKALKAEKAKPEVLTADCRYTELMGVNYATVE